MRQKTFLLLLSLFISCCTAFGQIDKSSSRNIDVVKNLVARLNDPKIASDIILSQNFLLSNELDDDHLDYLLASIDEARINVQSKNQQQLQYLSFTEMPRRETADIDLEEINPNQVVFVRHNKRLVFAAVVTADKIASITLVAKGNNKAHFVLY